MHELISIVQFCYVRLKRRALKTVAIQPRRNACVATSQEFRNSGTHGPESVAGLQSLTFANIWASGASDCRAAALFNLCVWVHVTTPGNVGDGEGGGEGERRRGSARGPGYI